MGRWILEGLRTRKPTTRYPARREEAAGVSPGIPAAPRAPGDAPLEDLLARCPARALEDRDGVLGVREIRCIHCFRCQREAEPATAWSSGFEWARRVNGEDRGRLPRSFGRSLHVRVVDAGGCGACMREMALLVGPHYNMHRLGLFITPTPRQADVLLVCGPVTAHMREPLREAFASMPAPRRVVAVGACATSGGVFGPSFACGAGAADAVPVDVVVPGCPPPPLAILQALLVVAGRVAPATPAASAEGSR